MTLSCAQPLYAVSGTREDIAAACCDHSECTAFDYNPIRGEGQLCKTQEALPSKEFGDATNKQCFGAPLAGRTAAHVSSDAFDTIDAAGKACLAEPACGAIGFGRTPGKFSLHTASGIAPTQQAVVLWKMTELCADYLWFCSDKDGQVNMVKATDASKKRGVTR